MPDTDTVSPAPMTAVPNPISAPAPNPTATRPGLLRRAGTRLVTAVRSHPAIAIVLGLGALLRVATMVGYGPAFYFSDTRGYFEYANLGYPQAIRPYGYSAFLNLFRWTDSIWPVIVTQHLLGLACAVGIYALVRRKGGARWLATVAAAPIALDGYEIVVEHYILADSLFSVLVLAGMICLLWNARVTVPMAIAAGLLLSAAVLTRTVGLPILILAGLYVLLRRVDRRTVVALAMAMVIPIVGYTAWFHHHYGQYTLSTWQDRWMYGRVMSIADCENLKLNPQEVKLCNRPENENAYKVDYYVWSHDSPVSKIPRRYAYTFSAKVMLQQPLDYSALVAGETWTFFSPDYYLFRNEPPGTTCPQLWEFQKETSIPNCEPRPVASSEFGDHRGAHPDAWSGFIPTALHDYQRFGGVTPGPLHALALLLMLGAVAVPLALRRQGSNRRIRADGGWTLRWDALLLGVSGLALLVMAVATSQFDIRYGVPILVLIPPAGALAWISLRHTLPDTRLWESARGAVGRRRTNQSTSDKTSAEQTSSTGDVESETARA
ncbi:MAG: phospholipid carrier-dependent glycosyltransferase [Mycobacteriales bacterium]